MQKRPSSRVGGSTRVDGILRYRSANEGVLCSARCRELSRTGLTATIDRPVFPGDLLRFDLEPAGGGRSVMGLARVAWTGSDPDGAPGTQIMRMRFLSLGDTSENALLEWLDELSDMTDRPSSPLDDSSVRALDRAIADSLLPPPPVLPGAPPSSEGSSSGLTPAPVVVPNRPSIPPPPGLYTRGTRDLTHPVETVGAAATSIAPPMPPPSTPPPKRASTRPPPVPKAAPAPLVPENVFPHPPSLFALDAPTLPVMRAVTVPPAAVSPAKSPDSPAGRRSAEVRERLARLQKRRADETPLSVPVEEKRLLLRDDAPSPLLAAPPPAVAMSVQPPLPLGALLNAPPQTTRRSTPPPPLGAAPPPLGHAPASSSGSWPALRVPPAIAAMTHEEPVERPSRETIPPPAEIPDMPPLRVSAPALDDAAERVELPRADRSPPRSDAPWSVPALPAKGTLARPWLAICAASLAVGAGLAYLVYGSSLLRGGGTEVAATELARAPAATAAPAVLPDDALAPLLPMPPQLNGSELDAPEAAAPAFAAKPLAAPARPALAAATATPGATLTALKSKPVVGAVAPATPPTAAVAAVAAPELVPVPVPEAKEIEPGDKLPPPPPELPVALGGAAPVAAAAPAGAAPAGAAPEGSRLERARDCLAHGDIPCATELLRNATTEPELELWIETLRAQGDGLEARRAMKRFVEAYPEGRRATIYRRILSNAQ